MREQLLTEKEVAEMLGVTTDALRKRRWLQREPSYVKIGRSVRYREAVVNEFILKGEVLAKRP